MIYTKKIIKQIAAFTLLILAAENLVLGGGLDNNPRNAGETQSRNSAGVTLDGAMGNPALIGLERPPRYGLSLLPLSVMLWSDKLSPPFDLSIITDPSDYISKFMRESFNLKGNDPGKISAQLTNELRDDIGVFTRFKTSPVVFATRGLGFSVGTFTDVDVKIPGGLLMPFFSDTAEGLLIGKKGIDLSNMRVNAILASEVAVKFGYSTTVPFLRDYLGLDRSAAGIGIKLLLGHAYFDAQMDKGSALSYDTSNNSNFYKADARLNVLSAGTGFHGNLKYKSDYLINNPINGKGVGLDIGTILHNNSHALAVDVQDIGMINWDGKEVRKSSMVFKKVFDMDSLQLGMDNLFKTDTLKPTNEDYILLLPASLNLGYTYGPRFDGGFGIFLGYMTMSLGCNQPLILGVGHSTYSPRFSAGTTLGLLAGFLPVRYGVTYGGAEKLSSAAGLGLDMKYFSTDVFYKAIGSPTLMPKRGFETGFGTAFRWGHNRSNVKNARKAALKPMTEEAAAAAGAKSAALNPDMPLAAEFFPYEGGPAEKIYEPVEINMFMLPPESEPAPEPEPTPESAPEPTPVPEPEPEPQLTEEETQTLKVSQRAINFVSGSAKLTEGSYAPLNAIANLLIQYPRIRYEIQGHTDSQGSETHNLLLSAERAAVVKYYLVSRGAPESSLVAVGYGKNIPIADNNSAVGRALNRRVEFVQILSQEHYDWVKRFELEMIPRLTDRVIIHNKKILEPRNEGQIISPATPPDSTTQP